MKTKNEIGLGTVENIVEKGENAGYNIVTSIFSFPHNIFKMPTSEVVKTRDCEVKSY